MLFRSDFSCVNGFCPSFVSVEGGKLKKRRGKGDMPFPVLPEPTLPSVKTPYGILVTGIGGTGVVTIGALLGMAAHIEGKGIAVLDQIGLAQKGGAVTTHVRIAEKAEDIVVIAGGFLPDPEEVEAIRKVGVKAADADCRRKISTDTKNTVGTSCARRLAMPKWYFSSRAGPSSRHLPACSSNWGEIRWLSTVGAF